MSIKIVHSGVIPYYLHNNIYYLFLSEEKDDIKKWCGFTGRRDPGEDLITTASREGWEESMGLLGDINVLKHRIKNANYAIFSVNGVKASVQYLIKCDKCCYDTLQDNFNNVIHYLNHCNKKCSIYSNGCYEKVKGQWIKLPDIMEAAVHKTTIKGTDGFIRTLFDTSLIHGTLIKDPSVDMFSKYL